MNLKNGIRGAYREFASLLSLMRYAIFGSILVVTLAILASIHQYGSFNPTAFFDDFYANLLTEVFSLVITITALDVLNAKRTQEDEFERLVLQMGSPNNGFAREAIRILRHKGWLDRLNGKSFWKANLEEAELYEASLQGADLGMANLTNANLNQAKLNGATLTDAYLEGAYLHGAILEGATIGTSDLRACLQGAELVNTNLKGAKFLHSFEETEEEMQIYQLSQVRKLCGTILPDGTKYDGRFSLLADINSAKVLGTDINDPVDMADYYEVTVEEYLNGQEWYAQWGGKPGVKHG